MTSNTSVVRAGPITSDQLVAATFFTFTINAYFSVEGKRKNRVSIKRRNSRAPQILHGNRVSFHDRDVRRSGVVYKIII